jgi:hypothetical protein
MFVEPKLLDKFTNLTALIFYPLTEPTVKPETKYFETTENQEDVDINPEVSNSESTSSEMTE